MDRRKFLGFGIAAVALAPVTLSALDFRKEKPDTWTAHKVDEAISALYGKDNKPTESKDIELKIPEMASSGGAVPVTIKSTIEGAKSVALFQDANPESAVAAWTVPENGIINYTIKIKMKGDGSMTVIVEDKDGKLHSVSKSLQVAKGGCEG